MKRSKMLANKILINADLNTINYRLKGVIT